MTASLRRFLCPTAVAAAVLTATAACTTLDEDAPQMEDEVAARNGHDLIVELGCGSCHMIPGVRGADGLVGPPLIHWSQRTFIAGKFPNTPENLTAWIHDPQAMDPGVDMPTLGITEEQAADIAAYLMTIADGDDDEGRTRR
jgi:cytochrome c